MSLEIYSTQITEGDDLALPITWTVKETGDPIDLTGSTIFFDAKDPDFDMDAVITNAAQGEYEFVMPAAKTAGKITKGGERNLDYLVRHTSAGGEIKHVFIIKLKVVGAHD